MKKKVILDAYEQEIEDNFENLKPSKNQKKLRKQLVEAAKEYVAARKSITIRVMNGDIIAIKAKAAKAGVPYQTYINSLIHKEAIK